MEESRAVKGENSGYHSVFKYSITCAHRPPKESNKSGLLQQVVFKCKFC